MEYYEDRMEHCKENEITYPTVYVTGTIGLVEFTHMEPLEEVRDYKEVRDHIMLHAGDELKDVFRGTLEQGDFEDMVRLGSFQDLFEDWVTEEVWYAFDFPEDEYKAFGLVVIDQEYN